ncbi:hypothetical protein [Roseomonas indoligenes]|uniref:Uncharacterized protein n=1 Tax=Roseomonas indoligenes TaxID=2820811 RepID=A0A940S547_9PROT|nr:hypothetical protein [Pararoseomonas indoligenes]MBP0492644.1 hypothetical protein [Pararoseomonas indoligenes]
MEISYDPDGRSYVSRYEVGDLVRLRASERGEMAMGRVGDWGMVVAVQTGLSESFDVMLAGYSERRTSSLKRLTGLTRRAVVPCDLNGVPIPLPERSGLRAVDAGMTRKLGRAR